MTLAEFVKKTFKIEGHDFCMRPRIICADGFKMSVQGSRGHYCSPRITTDWYNQMEIGFPSEKEAVLLEYAEDPDHPTDTVYGYVPCGIIEKVIAKHGGIDEDKTFENYNF